MSLVTVIMPSLNVAQYIEECIKSVLNQTLKDIEIICVDAGSTDGTYEILEKYAKNDTRIKLVHSDVKSYGYQVNTGIRLSNSEYIAILETDDYITSDMYETLYTLAKQNGLDYAAGDYASVFELKNERKCIQRESLFAKNREMYGKILNNDDINKLRASDYLLWKGIYSTDFLKRNNIFLHESPKAAFQDMGFLQQVKTYAQKVMYVDKSFYRYRVGRNAASSYNLNGLNFYKNEFQWIDEELGLVAKMTSEQKKYYYYTMSVAFFSKYGQILRVLNWNNKDERLEEPYEWFKNQLFNVSDNGINFTEIYNEKELEELKSLLNNSCEYALRCRDKAEQSIKAFEQWKEKISGKKAVIFGCGRFGIRTLRICDSRDIAIECFADNNIELQNNGFNGYKVRSIAELKEINNDYVIILAVKNGRDELIREIRNYNSWCDIVEYPPEI